MYIRGTRITHASRNFRPTFVELTREISRYLSEWRKNREWDKNRLVVDYSSNSRDKVWIALSKQKKR